VGLLSVTSADRLYADWTKAQKAREQGLASAISHVEEIMASLPSYCGLVTVIDGHPATLGWLGSVCGHRTRSLGVQNFGQSAAIGDLYRHYGIDARGIAEAVQAIAPGRPLRHLWAIAGCY
jgi:pyruvate dehydrogenase E1 component